ncbi:ATP-grasp domain-containing protein [Micromonospora globispora]|uniref:ATP-grasp domain-containing protein n=1 Tax=Micromonospora globispora TaxID=1450148 RepID=UPI001FAFC88A|nr:ATP-grasp domain-containing protein [Micromonospora globispora]
MDLDLGRDEMVVVGASLGVLRWLGEQLPPGSVVLVEEPDVIRRRGLAGLVAEVPAVSRVVPAEYQTGLAVNALLDREPGLAAARLVLPGLEYAVGAAARLAERLGLPGAGVEAADIFSDKHRMRLLADAAGLANPAYELVDSPAQATALADRWGGRCVLKPTRRSGSLGVQLIADPAEIARAWAVTAEPEPTVEATERGLPTGVLVEQTLVGPEYSVELLVADGEPIFANVTDKRLLGGRFPVETGHTVPAALPETDRRALRDVAIRLAGAAGFRTGVVHSEWDRRRRGADAGGVRGAAARGHDHRADLGGLRVRLRRRVPAGAGWATAGAAGRADRGGGGGVPARPARHGDRRGRGPPGAAGARRAPGAARRGGR